MATDFQMPKLGLTMEEGTIVEWLVDDGAEVRAGSPILLIETDKTETEVEASASGVLRQTAAVGETHPCGAVIGRFLAAGELESGGDDAPGASREDRPADTGPDLTPSTGAAEPAAASAPAGDGSSGSREDRAAAAGANLPRTSGGRTIASPNARRVAADLGVDLTTVQGTGPGGRITSEDVEDVHSGRVAPLAGADPHIDRELAATPPSRGVMASDERTDPTRTPARPVAAAPATVAARQLADLLGVDLAAVPADPADGRVTRDSVAAFVRTRLSAPAAAVTAPGSAADAGPRTDGGSGPARRAATGGATPALQEPTETIRLSGMRGTIASRMYASLQESAQLTLTMDADMDAVVADRAARKDAGNAPGFTDYVIAAAARALRDHPRVNSQVTPDGVALLPDVHVGLAVALDEGLIVPVVHHADRLSLGQLAPETTRLAEAARAGTLTPDEVAGGTFSVTALGMYGVDAFTPVINPPNAAILGVGRLRDDVVVVDGQVRTTRRVTLSLTWDHRILDGAPAAEFTKSICAYLAEPTRLV